MHARELVERFPTSLAEAVRRGGAVYVPDLPPAAQALAAWALHEQLGAPVVWIADGTRTLETAHRDLLTLAPREDDGGLLYFPAWESLPGQADAVEPDISGHRLQVLAQLLAPAAAPRVLATCVQALLQKVAPPGVLRDAMLTLRLGGESELPDLTQRLQALGYRFEPEVVAKGQAALKGGLLDVWPLPSPLPYRLEFFGSTLESLRQFDPATQRSVRKFDEITLYPADEWALLRRADVAGGAEPTLLAYLPADAVFLWADESGLAGHAQVFEEAVQAAGAGAYAWPFAAWQEAARARPGARHVQVGGEAPAESVAPAWLDMQATPRVFDLPREPQQPDLMAALRQRLFAGLRARLAEGYAVHVYLDTPGARDHFAAAWREAAGDTATVAPAAAPRLVVGCLSGGFVSEAMRVVVVAEPDLYGRRKQAGRRYNPRRETAAAGYAGERVADLTAIEPGDLVVHAEHGLGRYAGLFEIEFNGQKQEVLTIEYDEGAKLHVPTSHVHLLSRYVGLARHSVRLHRLGGRRWQREKADAERSVRDLAAALLDTQAHRDLLAGHAFGPDVPWQHEFEAAFPYQETPDQHAVIAAVKADMALARPMDRLVCGDAGYGKTEVALRAAFRAVMNGRQVALLVPTTVLAQQHYETFVDRMAAYPVRIETLSRFRSRREHHAILDGLREGTVDIVIGTHALLQEGVQFKNLGLAIVDEEQRFGVAHKERLKELRRLVDVLTLTATPIPRTLYMSLTGARDMSLLQTPPRERVPIETVVTRVSDKVVRDAILRELNREGQVYYLHNRVMTIEWVAERLRALVPEAALRVAHGQMASSELAAIMREFAAGGFDVLLCTTIIESGVDIPRANTILIDRADRFGIADLYQLRGRVGRAAHKGYAYLLLPPHGRIETDARKRIAAVKQHASLGAGFHLALRDLEIRGAGNLLGAEQSGHISAIGFGLYCQLLQRTVAALKGEPLPPLVDVDVRLDFISLSPGADDLDAAAMIPYTYIEDEALRIGAYRRLAEATEVARLEAVAAEWADRFGPVPPPAQRLLAIARIRLAAAAAGLRRVEVRGDRVMLADPEEELLMEEGRFPRLHAPGPDARLLELLRIVQTCRG